MWANLFEKHGRLCAYYQWEVIVIVVAVTVTTLFMDNTWMLGTSYTYAGSGSYRTSGEETNAVDVIFMTIIRCVAVLYTYYQFRKLRKLGSNYILGIAGLLTVFSSFVFSSTVLKFFRTDVSDLKDALFFFVLVLDLSKASVLAQFALSSSSQKELNNNIARGMALLGPTMTLDTIVGTLVISVGTLSGVKRLETLCWFACFSFLVNYFIFMTFYPACLSLVLELSRCSACGAYEKGMGLKPKSSPLVELLYSEGNNANPVVQKVKVMMSVGMIIVHAQSSHWSLNTMENNETSKMFPAIPAGSLGTMVQNDNEASDFQSYVMRLLTMSTESIVVLIIGLALKYVFFDTKEEFDDHVLQSRRSFGIQVDHQSCQTDEQQKSDSVAVFTQTDTFDNHGCDKPSPCEAGHSIQTQTHISYADEYDEDAVDSAPCRSVEECKQIYNEENSAEALTEREICNLVDNKVIRAHELEKKVKEPVRGVSIRRILIGEIGNFRAAMKNLPYRNYDYTKVMGACCENVIGYIPVPVGVCGPLLLDKKMYYVPMATTEGCLVASTNRGCRAITEAGGATSCVYFDGMTRGPVVRFSSSMNAYEAKMWMDDPENFDLIKTHFDETSRYARLQKMTVKIMARYLYIRFTATTGDAMGMNMISKGTEKALTFIKSMFNDMEILSISGNYCTDKKSSAVNWQEGRGKGVVCEAVIPQRIVRGVLKTTARSMVDVNMSKNIMGSAIAVTIGGFNAHAANIVTAVYIATGQDPAQNVCSSNCMTVMEAWGKDGEDLYISCTMPSIEVGTVGGGTTLPAQASCLDMLGVKGANKENPADNAKTLARIVCGTVLAGELSLMAALTEGHLVRSHLLLNRTSLSDSRKGSMIGNREITQVIGSCIPN